MKKQIFLQKIFNNPLNFFKKHEKTKILSIFALVIALVSASVMYSCSSASKEILPEASSKQNNKSGVAAVSWLTALLDEDYESAKIVFRHHGAGPRECPCPNCKCPGCTCPLGICACSRMARATTLSTQDIADDMGLLLAKIVNGKLHVVFKERTAALSDNTLPVSGDVYLEADLVNALNTQDIKVLEGTYQVDFSRYPRGEAYLDIENI